MSVWGILVYKADMRFPRDLLRFLYLVFFQPALLDEHINQVASSTTTAIELWKRRLEASVRPLWRLAFFHIVITPFALAFGTGIILTQLGMDMNWLKLVFYLFVAIVLTLSFSVPFCVAFLLPFSVTAAIWSSLPFSQALVVFFSLMLGLAYGLRAKDARWGWIAAAVYGLVLGILINPLSGLTIGATFLTGYFRIIFYLVEAPLSWTLGMLSGRGNALRLWRFHPVLWDALIWFPLPGLDRHLLAIQRQDEPASGTPILHVQGSFRQSWAAKRAFEHNRSSKGL